MQYYPNEYNRLQSTLALAFVRVQNSHSLKQTI